MSNLLLHLLKECLLLRDSLGHLLYLLVVPKNLMHRMLDLFVLCIDRLNQLKVSLLCSKSPCDVILDAFQPFLISFVCFVSILLHLKLQTEDLVFSLIGLVLGLGQDR